MRVSFTDDRGSGETLVSAATAAVAAALPAVSVEAAASSVTEGAAATFTLRRTGGTSAALTVAVSVSEDGAVLSGAPASAVTFGAGSAEASLGVATADDGAAEADGRVTVSVVTGPGYPWGRYALSERLSVWAVAGYGAGAFTLTREDVNGEAEAPVRTDLDLMMAAAGLRGILVQAPETGGIELAVKTDALGVRTSTARAPGLASSSADVTRLRLGLEGSRPFRFGGGAVLTPSVEIGVRHDGDDAETGFGADIGGEIAWSDPRRGLSAELRGRGLLSHASKGFRERGVSGALSWDPTPGTERGFRLTIRQTLGSAASGGMDALLSRGTLAGLAANDNGSVGSGDSGGDVLGQGRFELKVGYGLAAFGDRFTATPEAGFGFSVTQRDYSLGWRLTRAGSGPGSLELSMEARRREAANPGPASEAGAAPEHEIGLKLTARF